MTEKRNFTIDALKGFAMLLVVIGHSIYVTYDDPNRGFLFSAIYSFHMPLFMFISGYVTYKKDRVIDCKWLKNRFVSLVVPFVAWIFIPYIWGGNWNTTELSNQIVNVIKRPDYGLWFLWILFLNCCLLFLWNAVKQIISSKYDEIVLIAMVIVLNVINILIDGGNGWLGLGLWAWYSVFYVAGYIWANHKQLYANRQRIITLIGSVLFVLLVPQWQRTDFPIFIQPYEGVLPGGIIVIISKIFNYIVGFTGILFSVMIVRLIPLMCKKILAYLGKYTLEIYVLHLYIFSLVKFDNEYINMVAMVLVGIAGSIIIMHIIKKGILSVLMFGKK